MAARPPFVMQRPQKDRGQREPTGHARNWVGNGWSFLAKLLVMMLVNAFGLAAIFSAYNADSWVILSVLAVLLALANWIYFSRRAIPLKYLFPGLVFLGAFQVFVLVYTGYVAFTNYGTGHLGSMDQAVDAALIQDERRVEDSPTYPLAVVRDGGEVGFAITDAEGVVYVGSEDEPLDAVAEAAVNEAGVPTEVPGWEVVPRAELFSDPDLQNEVTSLRVPVSEDAEDGSIRTREGSSGAIYTSSLEWDPQAQTLTNTDTGVVYFASDRGRFVSEDGDRLAAGWYVNVGFDNFVRAFTDAAYAGPLAQVTVWTFAFAGLSVVLSFALGLFISLIYNDPRVKGRKILRTIFILPYAFPAFMSALLWRGMFNSEFGVVNEWFFFGAGIGWLTDPWLAKGAVLWVNLWLTYPYWLLVTTGALQAIPNDVLEAARIDGAGRWRQFSAITLPLLMVSTAPLAIASFAFNFNNFTIIYMLTGGGPAFPGASVPLGSTDILISAIYQISGVAGGRADYGLASALSIIVFIVIGLISIVAFRQTRKLEEI
ncbi:ABC transporter permease subunit [Bogoriella caseilytica]|uniref:Maltose/maltodextrin transport system permease protein n=1 Tax=Bogoriella caseilytica TaxID=56055 RepID=A0A3N2BCQ6_9MICO|nr:ABC transporter permease subunit [Bogoriella caseilytica]ROR73002.1 carbohydrate ABC transporter membrane protein 1 (CUT1 family) [Bogoriella caseilytica]